MPLIAKGYLMFEFHNSPAPRWSEDAQAAFGDPPPQKNGGLNVLRMGLGEAENGLRLAAISLRTSERARFERFVRTETAELTVCLESSGTSNVSGIRDTIECQTPGVYVNLLPAGTTIVADCPAHSDISFVTLTLPIALFEQYADPARQRLVTGDKVIEPRDGKDAPVCEWFPLVEPARLAARQILECGMSGALRDLYLRAKMHELLALCIDLKTQSRARDEARSSLRRIDIDRVHQAFALLRTQHQENWTIRALADAVGLNVKKLKLGFREIFDTSIHACLLEARMTEGERLLRCADENVDQVAYRVGFSSPSHFSQAFRKKYNISPSTYRRRFHIVGGALN